MISPLLAQNYLNNIARATLKEQLLLFVYAPWKERLQKRMDDLIHAQLKCNGEPCIRLRGQTYVLGGKDASAFYYGGMPPDRSIKPAAMEWLKDKDEIKVEERITGGSLSMVLSAVFHTDDLLALLPTSLHPTVMASEHFPFQGKQITPERMTYLRSTQQQYLDLLKQRQVRLLIT
jgi:hypothetical protein